MKNLSKNKEVCTCFLKFSLKLKLTTFLLFVTLLNVNANNYEQSIKISLDLKNVPVQEVLNEIMLKTDFKFLFNHNAINLNRVVSVKAEKESVKGILENMFLQTSITFIVLDKQIILTKNLEVKKALTVQENVITGVVTGLEGLPIPGVVILAKGTNNGVSTDFDGKYSIEITASEASLVFSSLGYLKQEIVVGEQTVINVVLKVDETTLEEVVIVGYGRIKRADLTGAVSSIKGDALTKASTPNLSAALAGKLTGVITNQSSGQPGRDNAVFSIRGISTTGNNAPLFIVDGVQRAYRRIDPNDIESVTVLKDAASTAVYGARAANGVLLITTKRGKKGETSFNYSGSYGFQNQTRKIELMNSGEYVKYLNEAFVNGGSAPRFTDEEVLAYTNGPTYDWLGAVLGDNAPIQKHSISARGGSEKVAYFVSYGYLDQQGLYKTAKYKQNNLRANLDIELTDRLDLSIDLSGRVTNTSGSPSGTSPIYQNAMFGHPFKNPDLSNEVGPGALGYNGYSGSPVGAAENSGSTLSNTNAIQTNFSLKYEVPGIDGLFAKVFYAYDYSNNAYKTFSFPYTYYDYNEVTDEYDELSGGFSSISLNESRSYNKTNNMQLSLNYAKTFGDHSISSLVLYEETSTFYNGISASRDDYISKAIPELFAGDVEKWKNNGSSSETVRRGYVGRVDYSYKSKYLLQANMRVDESYNFPKKGRTGVFPAASIGWKVSEENFMKNSEIINELKLRASYGLVGNDRVAPFDYLYNFQYSGGTVLGSNIFNKGIIDTGLPNVDITWEKAKTFDIGFDLGLFGNKITIEADYFSKRTEDILTRNSGVIPSSAGFGALPNENLGVVDSWGSEGMITYRDHVGDLNFTLSANYTWYDNKAIEVSESETVLPAIAKTGKALGLRIGYLSDGLFQTQEEIDNAAIQFNNSIHNSLAPGDIRYRDINGRDGNGDLTGLPDGKIDSDDRTIIGSSGNPNFVFGFNMNLEYKGIDLTANFQGATDYSRAIQPIPFGRNNNTYRELIDSWRVGNENAKYPRLTHGDLSANSNQSSDFWVTEVSYIRLRNLEIGYNFSSLKNVLSTVGIKNLRMFVSSTNVFTISNLDWRDPEGNSSATPFYPQVKTTSFGVNINF